MTGNARRRNRLRFWEDLDAPQPDSAIGRPREAMHHRLMQRYGQDPSELRVLVVEDDRDAAETLRTLLVLCGYQVMVAYTSRQGIETARKLEPHIVLCDIGLPDGDGYVVGSVLRQSGYGTGVRLIAVTGYGETHHRLRALAAGFDQHLVKPVDPRVLLHELQTIH